MKVVIVDTETNAISLGNIIQFSALIYDDDLGFPRLRTYNQYLDADFMDDGAYDAHKISLGKLHKLSEGCRFIDFYDDILNIFLGADYIIGHNVEYDLKYLKVEFKRVGMEELKTFYYSTKMAKIIDTMKEGTKFTKLSPSKKQLAYFGSQFAQKIGFDWDDETYGYKNLVKRSDIADLLREINFDFDTCYKNPTLTELGEYFGVHNINNKFVCKRLFGVDVGAHDARFDIVWCYVIAVKANLIEGMQLIDAEGEFC